MVSPVTYCWHPVGQSGRPNPAKPHADCLISADRAPNGYRDYSQSDVHRLTFLHRARALGFPIEDCRQLMSLYSDRNRASHDVREIASAHVAAIDAKLRELEAMRTTLKKLIHACHGDDRPYCPILEDLAGEQ